MNRWLIKYWMRNGDKIQGVYHGPETDSNSVFQRLFIGQPDNCFVGTFGADETSNLLVRIGDIAAIDISPCAKAK